MGQRSRYILVLLGLLTLIGLLFLPLLLAYSQSTSIAACTDQTQIDCAAGWMQAMGSGGIGISLIGMLIAALTVFPAEAVAMANGKVYGPVWGTVLSWSGGMLGANIGFFIARILGPAAMGMLMRPERQERMASWVNRRGPLALLTMRLIPLFPYFAVNYGAGLLGMNWWTFNWVSAIGMAPAAGIFTFMGSMAGTISWPAWAAIVAGVIAAFCLTARLVAIGRRQQQGLPERL